MMAGVVGMAAGAMAGADILIVEDDRGINDLMRMALSHEGYACDQAFTGIEAVNLAAKKKYHLVLLDVNLPDIDGFSLYRHLENMPVIFVTARDEIHDRLKGFDCGAEDYIIKPFDLQELLARVKVALRSSAAAAAKNPEATEAVRFAHVTVDFTKRAAFTEGKPHSGRKPVKLGNQEWALLEALIRHKNRTLTREQLLRLAWGIDYEGDSRTVDVHIRRLRDKLGLEEQIVTVYKTGYRLEI